MENQLNLDNITFISKNGDDIEFDKNLIKTCLAFTEEVWGEGLDTNFSTQSLNKFKNILETHNYDSDKIEVTLPVQSGKLEDHVDKLSYDVLKDLDIDQIKDLLDICEQFQCESIRFLLLTALRCQFFIGDKAAYIKKFKEENGIDEDLTQEEQDEIIDEMQVVFQELLKIYDTTHPEYKPKQFDDDEDEEDGEEEEGEGEDDEEEFYKKQMKLLEQLKIQEQQQDEDKKHDK